MAARQDKQRAPGFDPAASLDRFERRLESWLPAEPRPAWAEVILFALRLVLGRGSWVVGTLLIALGGPWLVYPYLQIDSMVRAAWYRHAATAHAEARVERVEVTLLVGIADGTQRIAPSVVLAFEPPPDTASDTRPGGGPPTVRLRYRPLGDGLEDYHQWVAGEQILHTPPRLSPGVPFRWLDSASAAPGFDVRWAAEIDEYLRSPAAWNGETYLDNALVDLDRPLDLLVGEWQREAPPFTVPVRFVPGKTDRVFIGDVLRHLPPTGGNGFGELLGACILMVPFGLPFYWAGTRLLSRPLPPRWRHAMTWAPIALLPFWGERYLEAIERLSPGALAKNALLQKVGSNQVLPASEPLRETALPAPERRVDFTTSRFAPLLSRVDLTRPAAPVADGDGAWRELRHRFGRALAAQNDAILADTLRAVVAAEAFQGRPALTPILVDGARRISVDPARGEAARAAAEDLLSIVLQGSGVDLCHPGFAAYREDLEPLRTHPEPRIAEPARQRLAEYQSAIEARLRDWKKIC